MEDSVGVFVDELCIQSNARDLLTYQCSKLDLPGRQSKRASNGSGSSIEKETDILAPLRRTQPYDFKLEIELLQLLQKTNELNQNISPSSA